MLNVKIAKADKVLSIDWDAMPENAQRHIIEYGLRQKLNDAGSSATVKELGEQAGPQALAMAEVVLEALMKGNVHVRQAAANLTLEERMFNKILKALVKKAGLDEGSTIDALASKLGKPVESINKAIEAKAAKDAEVQRQINALKLDIPDIEF
jgi:hypothetical protein